MAADLTRAELKLVEAAPTGAIADYRGSHGIENDLANGAQWDDERTISASVIYALAWEQIRIGQSLPPACA